MATEHHEICINVSIKAIRDGSHGISLSTPDKVLGEWTDSGAVSLTVTPENAISICDRDGTHRYLLTLPGTPVQPQQISKTEATVVVRM